MIRGVDVDKRDPRDYRDYENKGTPDREPEWLWSYGGTEGAGLNWWHLLLTPLLLAPFWTTGVSSAATSGPTPAT